MKIEQMVCFQKVVQCKSFTKAANELYTTQPSVSKTIDAMEKELGRQLFLRTSRGVELTDFGQRVCNDVRVILRIIDSWQEAEPDGLPHQEVHIQSTSTMCNFLSADFLTRCRKRRPGIDIMLHECRRAEVVREMLSKGINIGIVPLREENAADTAAILEVVKKNHWDSCALLRDHKTIFVSAKEPLAQKETVTTSDLKNLALSTYSIAGDENWLLYSKYFRSGGAYRRHSKESILSFVAQGKCATIFPKITSQYESMIRSGLIVPLDVQGLDMGSVTFQLIHPVGNALREAELVITNELKRYFKELMAQSS